MYKMRHVSKKEYGIQMQGIKKDNISKERKYRLNEEKKKFRLKFKLPSTSKLVLFIVFLMCIEILVFSQWAMIKLGDISAMYTLIGVPAALVPITLGYYWKSKNENTTGGIVYDMAMAERNQNKSNDTDSSEAHG